jgi:hypothetical protein
MIHIALSQKTMLSQLTTFIQVFDRQNYGIWSKAMHAFLMAQGLWGFTDGTNTEPYPPTDPLLIPPLATTSSQAESNAHDVLEVQYKVDKAVYEKDLPLHPALFTVWQKGNDMALGNLTLCLSPAIQQCLSPNFNAQETWEWLMTEFGSASLLRHGRDVHPTWVTFTMTGTLRSLDCESVGEY